MPTEPEHLVEKLGLLHDYITPAQFARRHGMVPQQVYYYIRTGVITSYVCLCQSTVVDAIEAEQQLEAHKNGN